ncbi:hypothetical protein FIBSPDRAFT_933890 [Athelia psychrophila]|uniref:MYND-type domain-containing protein n=1 Tax=Athelia psychrophila TaxID=1759441 RepID=A0A166GCC6_9AGAM|nr:hypothetical protein FIBSPDRAFT_933890 [Fibularhizoctonia sp. CBS 109695]
MPDHECAHCERPGTQRCSGCKDPNAWYCGPDCQRKSWPLHIFHCNPTKPINTAYYIAQAVIQDRFPDHEQALEDYGFTRAFSMENRSNLLGLYKGLYMYLDVAPKDLHRWRVRGILVQEIKAAFEKIPESHRGGYYPWFLKNQWILEPAQEAPDIGREMILRGWRYSIGDPTSNPPSDHITAIVKGWPDDKQACYEQCMMSLSKMHPGPAQRSWIDFGFCTCEDEYVESRLGVIYAQIVKQCTFNELLAAYRASSLAPLIDKYGFGADRESITHLQDVLSSTGSATSKSVWWLKSFVLADAVTLQPRRSVVADYGFMNCEQPQDQEDLKAIYKKFFQCREADPIALHNAAIAGKIFEYVGGVVKLKKKFRRLMKNLYPLPTEQSFPEIAN